MNRLLLFLITLVIGVPDGFAWDLAKNDIIQRSPTRAYYQFRKTFRKDIRAVTMDLFLFDTRRCQLRVMDQGSASNLAQVWQSQGGHEGRTLPGRDQWFILR